MKLLIVVLLLAASLIFHLPFLEARECIMNYECSTKYDYQECHGGNAKIECYGLCAAWQCLVDNIFYRVYGCEGDVHICTNKENTEYYAAVRTFRPNTPLELGEKVVNIHVDRSQLKYGKCDPMIAKQPSSGLNTHAASKQQCSNSKVCRTKDYTSPFVEKYINCETSSCSLRSCIKNEIYYVEGGCKDEYSNNQNFLCDNDMTISLPDVNYLRKGKCDPYDATGSRAINESNAFKIIGMILIGCFVYFFDGQLW